MYIESVRDLRQLGRMRAAWESFVVDQREPDSIFGSYPWYECWLRHFTGDAEPLLLVAREEGKVVGIAPLLVRRSILHGLPVNVVGFIENGNSLHNDFLLLPQYREKATQEMIRFLFDRQESWEAVILKNIPVASPNYTTLVKVLEESHVRWQQRLTFDTPYLTTAGTWSEYLAARSVRTRKTLRNIHNTMVRAGDAVIRNIRRWEEFQEIKQGLYDVARQSWTDRVNDSVASPTNREFFEDLAKAAAARDWLSVWTLELDGQMIAFEFHLRGYGKEHAMRGSYNSEFGSLSPGTFLEMHILQQIFEEEGEIEYDFGGSFDNYKKRWTETCNRHYAITFYNDRIYSRTAEFHETKTVTFLKTLYNMTNPGGTPVEPG